MADLDTVLDELKGLRVDMRVHFALVSDALDQQGKALAVLKTAVANMKADISALRQRLARQKTA